MSRSIDDVCLNDSPGFEIKVLGNTYCSLGIAKRISCPHQFMWKDHNGCYPCIHPDKNKYWERDGNPLYSFVRRNQNGD